MVGDVEVLDDGEGEEGFALSWLGEEHCGFVRASDDDVSVSVVCVYLVGGGDALEVLFGLLGGGDGDFGWELDAYLLVVEV